MILEWNASFNTGIAIIDEQHRGLVAIINELSQSIDQGPEAAQVKCEQTLVRLANYAKEHFSTEEGYMESKAYPGLAQHHQEHKMFVEWLEKIIFKRQTPDWPVEKVQDYLIRWLRGHVLSEDQKMGAHLRAGGVV